MSALYGVLFWVQFPLIYDVSCELFFTEYGISCAPIVLPFPVWAAAPWKEVSPLECIAIFLAAMKPMQCFHPECRDLSFEKPAFPF